jgi:hypothetical protein
MTNPFPGLWQNARQLAHGSSAASLRSNQIGKQHILQSISDRPWDKSFSYIIGHLGINRSGGQSTT